MTDGENMKCRATVKRPSGTVIVSDLSRKRGCCVCAGLCGIWRKHNLGRWSAGGVERLNLRSELCAALKVIREEFEAPGRTESGVPMGTGIIVEEAGKYLRKLGLGNTAQDAPVLWKSLWN